MTCHAHDQAQNVATPMSFAVTVLGGHDQMVALERSINAAGHLAPSSEARIRAALTGADLAMRAGARGKAKSQLGSFIGQIGQLHRTIRPAQKSSWISAAVRIITVIR